MGQRVHAYPQGDFIMHELQDDTCICGPAVQILPCETGPDGWQYIHHALDEELDQPDSPGWLNYVEPRPKRESV